MIKVTDLTKRYHHEGIEINALNGVSFHLPKGRTMAICGSSGAGKSTLLSLLGGLDRPTSGTVEIDSQNMSKLSEKKEAIFRNSHLGFIFQFHHLLNDFTICENVMMPLLIQGVRRGQAQKSALQILDRVGIADKINRYPKELSGGEQQRAAIARAVIHKPKLILADEPTGNLDDTNAQIVFDLLCTLNHDLEATLVVVTHHVEFAKRMNKNLVLANGMVVKKSPPL